MSYFAVIREAGPTWIDGQGAFGQPGVNDHAAFMNALADEGLVLLAGPLDGSEQGRIRVLLIGNALSDDEIGRRLADDPWERAQRIITVSIEPWNLLVGATKLGNALALRVDSSMNRVRDSADARALSTQRPPME
jgi:uncharacterized protein YciI